MVWMNDNGIIRCAGEKDIPDASCLYNLTSSDTIEFNGITYSNVLNELGIRFSKIGLNVNMNFSLENGGVCIHLYAIKANEKYPVKIYDGQFLDYIIIDNTWYYLGGYYTDLTTALENYSLRNDGTIDYKEFMNLSRKLDLNKNLMEIFDSLKENTEYSPIQGLNATLYPYQKKGYNWLYNMTINGCGSLLGDEMGLGKTLQVIALFGKLKEQGEGRFLVVAPVSLLENWRREIVKFYPSLSVCVHHGNHRTGNYHDLLEFDVIIMSYSNIKTDLSMLNMINWNIVVLDEAQNIKNPYASRTKCVKLLKKRIGIAVSGTPFENHMTDIWSIVDFILPDFLGSLGEFQNQFTDTLDSAQMLESFISPIILRRRVKDVAQDLPSRIDIPQPLLMTDQEAEEYEKCRLAESKCIDKNKIDIGSIQKLRMYCTHPSVYDPSLSGIDPNSISTKYSHTCNLLEEIFRNNEKVILFTSFNKMVELFYNDIPNRFGVKVYSINGSTPISERQLIVDEFSENKGSCLLVLNPKAAGTGLNITAANHVIHYNLEWNPALEDQASARAYRRGQNKTVFIHRLYYSGTVEEIINDRISLKRTLSNTAIIGNVGDTTEKDALLNALMISPYGGK